MSRKVITKPKILKAVRLMPRKEQIPEVSEVTLTVFSTLTLTELSV